MSVSGATKLNALEDENRRLKKLLAEPTVRVGAERSSPPAKQIGDHPPGLSQ
jgi:hypothetical protein